MSACSATPWGGGVSLNILTARPDIVDAVVLYAPVHADAWENFMRWRSEREEGDRTREVLGTREDNPAAWDALSSKTWIKNVEDPVLLFHGTNDKDVPIGKKRKKGDEELPLRRGDDQM